MWTQVECSTDGIGGVSRQQGFAERTEEVQVQAIDPSGGGGGVGGGGGGRGRGRTAAQRPHRRSSPDKSRHGFASAVCLPATHRHADKCLVTWGYT